MVYNFNVSKLYLTCTNQRKTIISNSVNFHTAKFTLDSDWVSFDVKAIFTNSKDNTLSVEQLLDVNNECVIPNLPISDGGYLIVKLIGEKTNARIETIMANDLLIELSSIGDGGEDNIFTPSIVEQLLNLINGKGDTLSYSNSVLKLLSGSTELSQVTISGGGSAYVEIVNDGTYIKYRTDPLGEWTNIISVAEITGADGKEVELQSNGTYIQWRYVGDVSWINLVELSTLKGDDGFSPLVDLTKVGRTSTLKITDINGLHQTEIYDGLDGDDGRGIAYISKVGSSGLVDTYTITFTDGTQTSYNVTNGQDGANGDNGNGIVSITKISTVGLVDNYRILFTDTTTFDYAVTNGQDGTNGLTTEVRVNDITYTQSGGLITLPNLEPMLPTSPVNPELKFLNANKQWIEVSAGSGGSSAPLYYTTVASDIVGYSQLSYTPQTTEVEASNTITNQEVLFRTYLYPTAINTTLIDAGTWAFTFTTRVSGANGITQFKAEPFLRHADGSETVLFAQYSTELNNTTYATITQETTQPPFTCLATDRLGIRMYGKTTSNSAITLYVILGDGRGGYFKTPLRLRHNQLRDFNSDPNYQHITQTWIDGVNSNIKSLLPQGILDTTSNGTISRELVRNVPIKFTNALTSLTLTYPTTYYWYDLFTVIFKTTALVLPSGVVWHDGTSPTIDSAKWYELSIRDGRAVLSGGVA